jgi:predicted transcriptional regulator
MNKERVEVKVRMSAELKKRAQKIADDSDRSLNDVFVAAAREYLAWAEEAVPLKKGKQ